MKYLSIALVALTVSGCDTVRTIAPQTTAGFETGGLLGAIDGASGAILARCKTLDGGLIRVAVDDVATATGETDAVEHVRELRKRACAKAGEIHALVDEPFEGEAQEIPVKSVAGSGATGQNQPAQGEKKTTE